MLLPEKPQAMGKPPPWQFTTLHFGTYRPQTSRTKLIVSKKYNWNHSYHYYTPKRLWWQKTLTNAKSIYLGLGSISATPHTQARTKMWKPHKSNNWTVNITSGSPAKPAVPKQHGCTWKHSASHCLQTPLFAFATPVPLVLCILSEDLLPRNSSSQAEPVIWGAAYMDENTGHCSDTQLFPVLPSKALRSPVQEQTDQKSKLII